MTGFAGTKWRRKKDWALIEILADPQSSGGQGSRSLLARNTETGRSFWVTPEGLARKYDIDGEGER